MSVDEAYVYCKEIIEKHSKTFSKAFNHLPKEKREAVWAVYAFCRTADDIVDEAGSDPELDLKQFKSELEQFASGGIPDSSLLWIALKDTFTKFEFDLKPFYLMIEGQNMDLAKSRYHNTEEVLDYSYHVASSVGLMLLPILAPDSRRELEGSAVSLGYAMQLTNILRDIGADRHINRVYLPEKLMEKYGYTMSMLHNQEVNFSLIALWEELAGLAERYYEEAFSQIHLYPPDARIPVKAAGVLYREILNSVRRNYYDVFNKRAFVSVQDKQYILSGIGE